MSKEVHYYNREYILVDSTNQTYATAAILENGDLNIAICTQHYWGYRYAVQNFTKYTLITDEEEIAQATADAHAAIRKAAEHWGYVHVPTPSSATQKQCVVCGNPFEAKRPDATMCGNTCRVRAKRQREKKDSVSIPNGLLDGYKMILDAGEPFMIIKGLESTQHVFLRSDKCWIKFIRDIQDDHSDNLTIEVSYKNDYWYNKYENEFALHNRSNSLNVPEMYLAEFINAIGANSSHKNITIEQPQPATGTRDIIEQYVHRNHQRIIVEID